MSYEEARMSLGLGDTGFKSQPHRQVRPWRCLRFSEPPLPHPGLGVLEGEQCPQAENPHHGLPGRWGHSPGLPQPAQPSFPAHIGQKSVHRERKKSQEPSGKGRFWSKHGVVRRQAQLSKGISLPPAPAFTHPSWPPSVAPPPHCKGPILQFSGVGDPGLCSP